MANKHVDTLFYKKMIDRLLKIVYNINTETKTL